ncbi:hypothetical protein [Micromonospora endophytica]|uniref:Uncharacterized protein n=1 Tax=Micromonospora endophytica TaxID=515350 RepID=A0A2W2C506_9ACTN|nr:hypothetical protein [Micromonospora endophytica]PZF94615.1 hypothetical protein C1I93_16395 [Micromonospora endophytica]RIW44817.1 hypothetical protein D3H59_16665 [Micromonospora endophytica]BCJ57543.1 hypothetical protein Jiend_09650 [Micromonospora endophytica]
MTAPTSMLTGDRIYRIHWLPGTDTLRGRCHCGAERTAEEPVELWEWLLAHPDGHRPPPDPGPPTPPTSRTVLPPTAPPSRAAVPA